METKEIALEFCTKVQLSRLLQIGINGNSPHFLKAPKDGRPGRLSRLLQIGINGNPTESAGPAVLAFPDYFKSELMETIE